MAVEGLGMTVEGARNDRKLNHLAIRANIGYYPAVAADDYTAAKQSASN